MNPARKRKAARNWKSNYLASRRAARASGQWFVDMMNGEHLSVAFQPIARAHDLSLFGQECLLRGWHGDSMVSPDKMFSAARLLGFTSQLDLHARSLSLQAAARHNITERIFINFAPSFGSNPIRSLHRTLGQIDELGLDREQVVLEITETECVRDYDECLRVLNAYRNAGFQLALDDAGSGYSSLKLLAELRPDILKLDQSLLRDVHVDFHRSVITRKLLETASELSITTVAEGIECEGEYLWARDNGADFVQGFYFGIPATPPSDATPFPSREVCSRVMFSSAVI